MGHFGFVRLIHKVQGTSGHGSRARLAPNSRAGVLRDLGLYSIRRESEGRLTYWGFFFSNREQVTPLMFCPLDHQSIFYSRTIPYPATATGTSVRKVKSNFPYSHYFSIIITRRPLLVHEKEGLDVIFKASLRA